MNQLHRFMGLAFAASLVLWGCNLFSPLTSDNSKDASYEILLEEGKQAVNKGDYSRAREFFQRAKAKYPAGSEAHLFHAKAIMADYGHDFTSFNNEFNSKKAGQQKGIPFLDSTTTLSGIDSVYFPVYSAVADLEQILRHSKDTLFLSQDKKQFLLPNGDTASDGKVSEGVARLDLGLLQAVKAMLAPLDMDGNGRVDSTCGRNICPTLAPDCLRTDVYKATCKTGPLSEVKRFQTFKQLTQNLDIDNINSNDLEARYVSTNPNDINGFLDAMAGPMAGSNNNLDSVNNALASHNEEKLQSQIGGIVGSIKDLNNFLAYMRHNDSLDNDFDRQSVGPSVKGDIMVWHDYNRDGRIRFDYDRTYEGYPETAGDIGHPLHRYFNPDLYVSHQQFRARYPQLAADSSENSRMELMIRYCRELVSAIPQEGNVTSALLDSLSANTCPEITSVLRPEVRPSPRSDWLSGTFGIDEEMLDRRDNDLDGLRDEDTRNAVGMDDDDDSAIDLEHLGQEIIPMQWKDVSTHVNQCPDIDTTIAMIPGNPRRGCLGSLENRLHLARTASDSLPKLYSPFPDQISDADCLDDIEKLDPEFLAAENYTQIEKNTACTYKHIWIAPRPPHSEWSGGVLGVDEEYLDGVDNDGDGWVDEDVKW